MEENSLFTVETLLDPPLWREYTVGYRNASLFRTGCGISAVAIATVMILHLSQEILFAYAFLIAAVPVLVHRLVLALSAAKGDPQYRNLVKENGGEIPHRSVTLGKEEILSRNIRTGRETKFTYDSVRKIIETKRLLIVLLKTKAVLLLEKRWIRGGSEEELKVFLLENCPGARKRIHRGSAGRAVNIVLILMLVLGSVLSVCKIHPFMMPLGKLHADMSCTEILSQLEPLGITCKEDSIPEEIDDFFYSSGKDKVLDLLCWLGYGEYDLETWEWTPGENGVYWFDAEFGVVNCMYTDFLRGISALDREALVFADIREDHTDVDWDLGTGTVRISFVWKGKRYEINAEVMDDWFDESVLHDLCRILSEDGEKTLYYAFDGGQGYLVFYGDAQWAAEFSALTGIQLETK